MKIRDLILNTEVEVLSGDQNMEVQSICIDSRETGPDTLFIAIRGTITDGHAFIPQVLERGCKCILVADKNIHLSPEVLILYSSEPSVWAGELASRIYGKPSEKLKVVGITGTNGKTSVATLCYQLFSQLGYKQV